MTESINKRQRFDITNSDVTQRDCGQIFNTEEEASWESSQSREAQKMGRVEEDEKLRPQTMRTSSSVSSIETESSPDNEDRVSCKSKVEDFPSSVLLNPGIFSTKNLGFDNSDNMKKFLMQPLPKEAGTIQCYIKRNRKKNKLYPEYW